MKQCYSVGKKDKLLPFLFDVLSVKEGWSKKRVKQRLQSASVFVNLEVQTKHDFVIFEGDKVHIGALQHTKQAHTQQKSLEIIYQDADLIAINKPAGLLSVGTNKENKNHALALLRTQLSRRKNSVKLWPVHRLDRDTSGILLFATSKEMREAVMNTWTDTEKVYLAIVEGIPKIEADTITQPLLLDEKEYRMHVGSHKDAKSAITHYMVKKSGQTRAFLEVRIETGRQHQIRAHMAWLGHAVVGDIRYGKKTNNTRMGLHAMRLKFLHPVHKKQIHLEVDAPEDFHALLT